MSFSLKFRRVINLIKSKADLNYYIESDLKSLNCYPLTVKMRLGGILCPEIWKYQILLRKMEYRYNCKRNNILQRIVFSIARRRFTNYGYKFGFSIPFNVFGPGLCIFHVGTLIVNPYCRVGSNCRVHAGVNIGNSSNLNGNWVPDNVPMIGNNVYIGPGAKIYGKITIGDNVAIGANAVVNKDVPCCVTVAGVPARVISNKPSNVLHGDTRI